MVWFQCEDCGENLKKPKLLNHFRCCSAFKLSCIDCGVTFGQESVQGHNQCISEAEKYGPKGQVKASSNTPAKTNNQLKEKPNVDINVGLSSRPPWYCSLCNTSATSKQTLLLHAEGKKHRAKARAFHASKEPPKSKEESSPNVMDSTLDAPKEESVANKETKEVKEQNPLKDTPDNSSVEGNGKVSSEKKRKFDSFDDGVASKKDHFNNSSELSNGEVVQTKRKKVKTLFDSVKKTEDIDMGGIADTNEAGSKKIKWKKIITSVLKSCEDSALDKRELRSLVKKTILESHPSECGSELNKIFKHKVTSSSRFIVDKNIVRLVAKK